MARRKFVDVDFTRCGVPTATVKTGGVPVATTDLVNLHVFQGNTFEVHHDGENLDILFTMAAGGATIPNDNADDDGIEMVLGVLDSSPGVFTVGTDAAFYFSCKFTIPLVSDYDCAFVGFRKVAAFAADGAIDDAAELLTAYADIAGINVNAGDFRQLTRTGTGTGVNTDVTTTAWADTETHTITIKVSAAGVTTFFVDDVACPGAIAYTFTNALKLMPVVIFAKGAAGADTPPVLVRWTCGLQ